LSLITLLISNGRAYFLIYLVKYVANILYKLSINRFYDRPNICIEYEYYFLSSVYNNHLSTSVLGNYFILIGKNISVPICADFRNV